MAICIAINVFILKNEGFYDKKNKSRDISWLIFC